MYVWGGSKVYAFWRLVGGVTNDKNFSRNFSRDFETRNFNLIFFKRNKTTLINDILFCVYNLILIVQNTVQILVIKHLYGMQLQ